jgi:butyrate kinase
VAVQHASNLGALIAHDLASKTAGARAFIADPIVVDELNDLARFAGHPSFSRISVFHALNQKAVARTYANSIGRKYTDLNLIVAHLGGGISVGAHEKGRVIDVNQALDGEGPFSPERSGTLPVGQLITMCFSNKYTEDEIRKMVVGQGGLVAYLGTSAANVIEERISNGDQYAKLVYEAMAYQVAKEIGACSVVLNGQVDAILITGGIAFNELFIQLLTHRISWISPILVFPGEDEMRALALNVLMVINGELEPKIYK